MKPWDIAKSIAAATKVGHKDASGKTIKGGTPIEVAEWRQELTDLVGEAEAKRLVDQAREEHRAPAS